MTEPISLTTLTTLFGTSKGIVEISIRLAKALKLIESWLYNETLSFMMER